jgi:hypothetical protein
MSDSGPEIVNLGGASCAIYRDGPSWAGRRTAAIGNFSCASADDGSALLRDVARTLARECFEAAVGPMDGDTWHKYRVVAESDGSPPYFLEPTSGPHDLSAFRAAGFTPISSYVSARAKVEDAIGAAAPAVADVSITTWDGENAGALISGLFDLSRAAFANNAFYKPIEREAFLKLYEPVLPAIDPRLVFFARANDRLAGYLFALPDRVQGAKPTTAILKTYASSIRGVGHMLVDTAHRTFRTLGYTDVIHALMHVDNQSRERSNRHHGAVFRRYDLMGLSLKIPA